MHLCVRFSPTALCLLPVCLLLAACGAAEPPPYTTWRVYKGDAAATSYAALDQINRSNVHRLEVAWSFRTGDEAPYTIECNPIVVDGVLYATSPSLKVFALDAATGALRWTFDPFRDVPPDSPDRSAVYVNRGVAYWEDGDDRRILFSAGPTLYALDAATGIPIPGFGNKGAVDLRQGLDRDVTGLTVGANTPGVVYRDLLILGSVVGEGPAASAPGHVRAYNVRTGARAWIFHTIPHPGEFGYETWPPDAWQRAGGANAWGGVSLDEARGLAFVPTGSASYDHYGADRHGANLFANTVLALKAETGERVWHFQAVHHDVWDYDLPCPPNLVTVVRDGTRRDAVAQVTKMGHLFLFDRTTGMPLFPVEERPVPQTQLPGEATWPTQPYPMRPPAYARQGFTEEDVTDRTPEAGAWVRRNILARYGESALFTAPSEAGSVVLPQFNGGTDWGGAAVDPEAGILYVNASNEPELLIMAPRGPEAGHAYAYVATGHQPVTDPDGFPISKRPWGTLNAIDLNRGEILWQVPLGTYPALEQQGLPPTGTFNIGGPIVTAGGLVFIGASMDERFHAYDRDTGRLLWEHQLPAGGYATPATYMADGKQYVVIAAGGGGKPGTKPGDAYLAFALP